MREHEWEKVKKAMAVGVSLVLTGCVMPFSDEVRGRVDKDVKFEEVYANPEGYIGKVLVIGGKIIETNPQGNYTEIIVLQLPLSFDYSPSSMVDASKGRFILKVDGFLDPEIYFSGRKITVAGEVLGSETRRVGDTDYRYPVLKSLGIKLWEPTPENIYVHGGVFEKIMWGPYSEPYWGPPTQPRHWFGR
jgi:outer membrane lipoprotein